MGDHPREYGENLGDTEDMATALGPSPRIRGESGCPSGQLSGRGTIPANTGRILRALALWTPRRDHPREYGENETSGDCCVGAVGPSPRIRGESITCFMELRSSGTIPANTGRIGRIFGGVFIQRDHPREYGENTDCSLHTPALHWTIPANTGRMIQSKVFPPQQTGPSPRIRGECLRRGLFGGARDHPREYGENR